MGKSSDRESIGKKLEKGFVLDADGNLQMTGEVEAAAVNAVHRKQQRDGHLHPMPGSSKADPEEFTERTNDEAPTQ